MLEIDHVSNPQSIKPFENLINDWSLQRNTIQAVIITTKLQCPYCPRLCYWSKIEEPPENSWTKWKFFLKPKYIFTIQVHKLTSNTEWYDKIKSPRFGEFIEKQNVMVTCDFKIFNLVILIDQHVLDKVMKKAKKSNRLNLIYTRETIPPGNATSSRGS